jgi:nitrite reductase/ring-hydroxylating ferredoxin subunit
VRDVGALEDFEEGVARVVKLEDSELGIVIWDGRPHAVRNLCPHMLGPLAEGVVAPRLCARSPLDRFDADRNAPVLVCPWHGWAFDLHTGEGVFEESRGPNRRHRYKVKRYDAEIVDGRVLVDI